MREIIQRNQTPNRRPNFAHLATLMPNGSPHGAPVWIAREPTSFLIATAQGRSRAKIPRRDPRVSLSIIDFDDPYTKRRARPRHRTPSRPATEVLRFAFHKYIGKPWPYREEKVQLFSSLRSPKQIRQATV